MLILGIWPATGSFGFLPCTSRDRKVLDRSTGKWRQRQSVERWVETIAGDKGHTALDFPLTLAIYLISEAYIIAGN
jgi:hypothetical protein